MTELPDKMPRDAEGLKALANQLGCRKKDLFVLAEVNDPFNADTPTKRRDAEWFAGLWRRFDYTSGVHTRRIHYQAQSTEGVCLPDGTPYVNTEACWVVLELAAKHARDLALVDPRMFADRRNPASKLFVEPRMFESEPRWSVMYGDRPLSAWRFAWSLPGIDTSDLYMGQPVFGEVEVEGYGYEHDDQPYLLELWCEKSTMDDILVPLCRNRGVNYTPGTGFTSKTRIAEMLRRAQRHDKPVRVLVISDYDPAGSHMAAPIARNIEYYRDLIAPDVDIAVDHIGMTREWAERYELPRTPIKEDDRRKANFEAIHGAGCVELDALEALRPGALGREIRDALGEWIDTDLTANLERSETEADESANEQWHAITAPIVTEVEDIRAEVNEVTERYRERLTDLSDELAAELEPFRERLATQWAELVRLATDTDSIELPERPSGEVAEVDTDRWLYDSRRHWREQLDAYRTAKNGGATDD